MKNYILTLVTFSPLLGIALIALVPRKFEEGVRAIALFTSLVTAALSCYLWVHFDAGVRFAFQEKVAWIPSLNINYHLGIDGVSLLMIALTAFLVPLCIAVSWEEIKNRRKEFYALILACEIGLIGAFASLDLFLFYVFWEVMLIPMYFLIGMWGSGNRIFVALKFLLYTMVGSVVMLVGLVYLYLASNNSFDMTTLGFASGFHTKAQLWMFLSFALAFAIKVPMFPFHTWLPDAHTEAPTAGSVLLAGVFLKVGTYGFYRIAMPYFPDAVEIFRPYIFSLAVIGIVYGALISMVQTDFKRLIAYSSVSHLGFVILGLISLNQEGVQGAVLQMMNHGISTGALFLLFGMIYARAHTREIAAFGGVAKVMPIYAGLFVFTGFSSAGLPGLNNFVGEILILLGAFKAKPVFAIVSASCVVLAAVYILWAIERVFFGAAKKDMHLKDVNVREIVLVAPLFVGMVFFGIYPNFALSKIGPSTEAFLVAAKQSVVEPKQEASGVTVPEVYKRKDPEVILPTEKLKLWNNGKPETEEEIPHNDSNSDEQEEQN